MKRMLSGILLTSGLWVLTGNFHLKAQTPVVKQTQQEEEIFYTYYREKIALNQRNDIIAVAFKAEAENSKLPLYLKLQQDFRRNQNTSNIEVEPLGKHYALIKMTSNSGKSTTMQLRLSQKAYVDATLPVVYRREYAEEIILPNEIIVSFDEQLSQLQKQLILQQHNLEIIRPLRFSTNRYVVKSKTVSGTGILTVANQLYRAKGVKSATPNFIQLRSQQNNREAKQGLNRLKQSPKVTLISQQWHLNSTPLIFCLTKFASNVDKCLNKGLYKESTLSLSRTDIRAREAWQNSNAGKGVVVAVLDFLFQWDHPDLINNVYRLGNAPYKLAGETNGWDFANNDSDTRISQQELSTFASIFRDSYRLSDKKLLEKYSDIPIVRQFYISSKKKLSRTNQKDIAKTLRNHLRSEVARLFHGTWVGGIIAANSQETEGLFGVAPQASILPVAVGKTFYNSANGFTKSIEISEIVEGIDYAVARGADIVNMSFGTSLPIAEIKNTIIRAQNQNPSIVFVAAAGNENYNRVVFPAAIKGTVAVGATNINGNRTPYSNFGSGLTIVAPGGDFSNGFHGGILTTGGTQIDEFWQGISPKQKTPWGSALDSRGKYIRVEGTSFASPVVAGVIALMKGEDPQRLLSREQIISILKQTASYNGLTLSQTEKESYKLLVLSAKVPPQVSIEQYFFGSGLVNAQAAVKEVQCLLKKMESSRK